MKLASWKRYLFNREAMPGYSLGRKPDYTPG